MKFVKFVVIPNKAGEEQGIAPVEAYVNPEHVVDIFQPRKEIEPDKGGAVITTVARENYKVAMSIDEVVKRLLGE